MLKIFNMFMDNIPAPIWIIDRNGIYIYANKAYVALNKIPLDKIIGSRVRELFEGELGIKYEKNCREVMVSRTPKTYSAEVDDQWIQCFVIPLGEEGQEIEGIAGLIIDVSETRNKTIELEKQHLLLRTIIDAIPSVIFYKDTENRYMSYNKMCSDFYKSIGIDEIAGKTDLEINPNIKLAQQFIKDDQEIMRSKKPLYTETTFPEKDGEMGYREVVKVPVVDENQEVWGIVGLSTDITYKKQMENKLRDLSRVDTLTGAYNRLSFEERLRELEDEKYLPLGLILGDVNGLKLVNDTLGHLEGDHLLQNVTKVLKGVCKEEEHLFRWGGDEFVILIPNATQTYCEEMIEVIQKRCQSYEKKFIQMSISLGVALKTKEKTIDECLKEADARLYRQKLLEEKSINSAIVYSLQNTLEAKDKETKEHTQRMLGNVQGLGKILKLTVAEIDELRLATQFHDIGKIGISEEILLKPILLTPEEYEVMKTHAEKGFRILKGYPELYHVARSILTHHERWDGEGYPLGLKGEDIPYYARIVAVLDAYDAMTHNRVYGKCVSPEAALQEIIRCAGTQFDPTIVQALVKYMGQRQLGHNIF